MSEWKNEIEDIFSRICDIYSHDYPVWHEHNISAGVTIPEYSFYHSNDELKSLVTRLITLMCSHGNNNQLVQLLAVLKDVMTENGTSLGFSQLIIYNTSLSVDYRRRCAIVLVAGACMRLFSSNLIEQSDDGDLRKTRSKLMNGPTSPAIILNCPILKYIPLMQLVYLTEHQRIASPVYDPELFLRIRYLLDTMEKNIDTIITILSVD